MVLLTYSIEQTLFCYFLLAQLAKENRELCSDSSSFIEEVLGRIFNRLHLFPFYVGEYSQIVGSTLLRQNNHVSMESSGDEARRLTFQRTGLELLQGFVLQLN